MNERVKEIRISLNLTQPEFGSKLGVTATAISRVEKGERSLTDQMARAICNTYNVNYTWLKEGAGEMFNKPDISTLTALDTLLLSDNDAAKQLLSVIAKMDKRQWEIMAEILTLLKK